MSFESWVKNSWLERLQADAPEIARLLALADGRLADYEKAATANLSHDVQLGLAYDVIRVCGTAALRAAGCRVMRGNNEHYRTIEALEFSIDPERKIIPTLDKLRKKRNVGAYDDYGVGLAKRGRYMRQDGCAGAERRRSVDSQELPR